jgi:hypothetical protein
MMGGDFFTSEFGRVLVPSLDIPRAPEPGFIVNTLIYPTYKCYGCPCYQVRNRLFRSSSSGDHPAVTK